MHVSGLTSRRRVRFDQVRSAQIMSVILILLSTLFFGAPAFAETPAVGAKLPISLCPPLPGKAVRMSKEQRGHELVLVVLRGFPGYQCPYCVRQVHDFIDHASDFAAKNTRVLLVYPGPPANLDQHAKEFLEKQAELPSNIVLISIRTMRSRICTGCDGTPLTKRHIRRPSFLITRA